MICCKYFVQAAACNSGKKWNWPKITQKFVEVFTKKVKYWTLRKMLWLCQFVAGGYKSPKNTFENRAKYGIEIFQTDYHNLGLTLYVKIFALVL